MHYWNKANFENLKQLAEELKKTPGLSLLSEYCLLREKGLRKQALQKLDSFLETSRTWDPQNARRQVDHILSLAARFQEAHQFMTHPLLEKFIHPVLTAWTAAEPNSATPLRWQGLLKWDEEALKKALSVVPDDVPVRQRLITISLDNVDHATHHLGESILLTSIEVARDSLDKARQWIGSAPDRAPFSIQSDEADYYAKLLDDWESYSQKPEGSFPEWCAKRGREYGWGTIVYYQ